jgi:dTDP-4-amino-4,6-dideoxygalactose transaminase
MRKLRQSGDLFPQVPCHSGSYSKVYHEKAFSHTSRRPTEQLPIAGELGKPACFFLVHPGVTPAEIGCTIEAVRTVMAKAVR